MIQPKANSRNDCVVHKPRSLKQISYYLGRDLYIFSFENENSNGFFKHSETYVQDIRKDMFFRVFDNVSRNVEALLFQLK